MSDKCTKTVHKKQEIYQSKHIRVHDSSEEPVLIAKSLIVQQLQLDANETDKKALYAY